MSGFVPEGPKAMCSIWCGLAKRLAISFTIKFKVKLDGDRIDNVALSDRAAAQRACITNKPAGHCGASEEIIKTLLD